MGVKSGALDFWVMAPDEELASENIFKINNRNHSSFFFVVDAKHEFLLLFNRGFVAKDAHDFEERRKVAELLVIILQYKNIDNPM